MEKTQIYTKCNVCDRMIHTTLQDEFPKGIGIITCPICKCIQTCYEKVVWK